MASRSPRSAADEDFRAVAQPHQQYPAIVIADGDDQGFGMEGDAGDHHIGPHAAFARRLAHRTVFS